MRPALPRPRSVGALESPRGTAYLLERLAWLVRLRWVALAVVLAATVAASALDLFDSVGPLLLLTAGAATVNTLLSAFSRRTTPDAQASLVEDGIAVQLLFDALLVTSLLHFAGGSDNPFVIVLVFPMAIAGMLLPFKKALLLGTVAAASYSAVMGAEVAGLIAHQPIQFCDHHLHDAISDAPLWDSPLYFAGHLAAVSGGMLGVLLFVGSITRRLREAEAREREHERVVLVHERLARVGALAAGVAHSIRNPLHGMLNCVDLLQRRVDASDDGAREILDLMSEGVSRIERVTSRLLELTRDAPRERLPTDVGLLVQDALRFVEVKARSRGIRIAVDVPELARLELDAVRMAEAVANVLDNAVDAAPDGGEVAVRCGEGEGAAWIEVTDAGPGIPPENMERLFDPFFTTKPVGEGTGLGLAIARRIVEDHHGEIQIESHPGEGTMVRILLRTDGASGRRLSP